MQDIYIILEGVTSNARDMDRSSVGQKIERNKQKVSETFRFYVVSHLRYEDLVTKWVTNVM